MEDKKDNNLLGVDNGLVVTVLDKDKKMNYIDQECCTCLNILLTNDGEIATSFLGVHSEEIIHILKRAQKIYFKKLERELKKRHKEYKVNRKNYKSVKIKKEEPTDKFDVSTSSYDDVEPLSAMDQMTGTKQEKTKPIGHDLLDHDNRTNGKKIK